MGSADVLVEGIKTAFAGVPFPSHCGLHAAMAMDDWIDDKERLRAITKRKDHPGTWCQVPKEHLIQCLGALDYLDAAGVDYYLPAYMKAVVEDPDAFDKPNVRSSSWQVVSAMLPSEEDEELKQYFSDQFSRIRGEKKRICRAFLMYIRNSSAYNEHARTLAQEALDHAFWSVDLK